VNLNYDVPFSFKGKIDTVTIDLKPMEAATGRGTKSSRAKRPLPQYNRIEQVSSEKREDSSFRPER
jgi:hypothetical protein